MKKQREVHHQIFHKTMVFLGIAVFVLTAGLILTPLVSKADDGIDPFIPYAATVDSVAVPLVPNPGCPDYILVQNDFINVENPYPQFGLFILPSAELDTYDNETLDVPLTDHIGGYIPIPELACGITPLGGPIFPVFFDGEFFLDGGSLGPNL